MYDPNDHLQNLVDDFNCHFIDPDPADMYRPLGVWPPLADRCTEPLLLRFDAELATVPTGEGYEGRLNETAERFGAGLDMPRRVWGLVAEDAVSRLLTLGDSIRLGAR